MGRSGLNGLVIAGILVFLLGAAGLAVPYFTTEDTRNVARLGDLKLQTTESTPHAVPPLLSGSAVVLGIVLIGAGVTRRS
jgi:hypothetical protein